MIVLVQNPYRAPHHERQRELEAALARNASNPLLRHVLHEADRPTFRDLFEAGAAVAQEGDVVLVANTDVWFDESVALLDRMQDHHFVALSRWDRERRGPHLSEPVLMHHWSQDAWAVRAGVPFLGGDYPPGTPGCDNRLAWEAREAGLVPINPCWVVRAWHEHQTGLRWWREEWRLDGEGLFVLHGGEETFLVGPDDVTTTVAR